MASGSRDIPGSVEQPVSRPRLEELQGKPGGTLYRSGEAKLCWNNQPPDPEVTCFLKKVLLPVCEACPLQAGRASAPRVRLVRWCPAALQGPTAAAHLHSPEGPPASHLFMMHWPELVTKGRHCRLLMLGLAGLPLETASRHTTVDVGQLGVD